MRGYLLLVNRLLLAATLLAAAPLFANSEAKKGHGEAAAEAPPPPPTASSSYVHHWLPMPPVTATQVLDRESVSYRPTPGRAMVVIFLASWCEPCQDIMKDLTRLRQHQAPLPVDFVYVFAHDTRDDARGFMQEHQLTSGVLANFDVLKAYHNPELPSVYVGDRHGWLLTRRLKAKPADIEQVDDLLRLITAY